MAKRWQTVRAFFKLGFRFLLYSNFWIALCALAHGLLTQWLLVGAFIDWVYPAFLFSGTVAQYSMHRLISLHKHKADQLSARFLQIQQLEIGLWIIMALGSINTVFLFLSFDQSTQAFLIAPMLISLLYVLPLWKGKRLRDIPFIKLFLIAIAWTLLTSPGMGLHIGLGINVSIAIQIPERLLFLLAITIPFDIRDLLLDQQMPVKTFPAFLGNKGSKSLALIALMASFVIVFLQVYMGYYSGQVWVGMLPSYLLAGGLIAYSHANRPDGYYTFFLDGTILLQALGVFLVCW